MQDFLNTHPIGVALFFNMVGVVLNVAFAYLVGREVLKALAPKTRVWVAASVAVLVSILYLWFIAALVFVDLYAIAYDLGAWGVTAASLGFLGYVAGIILFIAGIITEVIVAKRTRRFLNSRALSWYQTIWHMIRLPIIIYVTLFFVLVVARIPAVNTGQKTAEAVNYIQSQRITMADVMGTNMPPVPYEPENDATVAGIDKNNNGIRDDVELAIFKKYPNSAKIRAAELQYALAEQMFLTQVFNTETWKAVAEEDSRAFECATEVLSDAQIKEVENWVYDTMERTNAQAAAYEFTTSNGTSPGTYCDIDLKSLPN